MKLPKLYLVFLILVFAQAEALRVPFPYGTGLNNHKNVVDSSIFNRLWSVFKTVMDENSTEDRFRPKSKFLTAKVPFLALAKYLAMYRGVSYFTRIP